VRIDRAPWFSCARISRAGQAEARRRPQDAREHESPARRPARRIAAGQAPAVARPRRAQEGLGGPQTQQGLRGPQDGPARLQPETLDCRAPGPLGSIGRGTFHFDRSCRRLDRPGRRGDFRRIGLKSWGVVWGRRRDLGKPLPATEWEAQNPKQGTGERPHLAGNGR
jgi:hypothetical protein